MPCPKQPKPTSNAAGTDLDFRAKLWASADALRNNMDADLGFGS